MKLKDVHLEAKRCIKNNFWKLFFVVLLNYIITLAFTQISESFDTFIFKLIFLILSYAITVPLSYGVLVSFMKSSREENFSIFDFISDGMKSFKRVWCVFGRTILKLILPIIILVIGYVVSFVLLAKSVYDAFSNGGSFESFQLVISAIILIASTIYYIVKAISYSLTNYILYDNPELSSKEIVEESNLIMNGNKISYVKIIIYNAILYIILIGICSLIMTNITNLVGIIINIILMLAGIIILLPYTMGLQVAFYNLLKNGNNKNEIDE